MAYDQLVNGKKGEKHFLLGNEAAVRGAIEAGLSVAATYPGTPSSEIGNILSFIAKDAGVYFEFSTNEKVAMEVAATSAVSGLRSFTFMKHVGLNVAADSFVTTAYSGVKGGMVILVADDPSVFSSQNEQDTRNYARLANMPVLEPSNPQEVKDMMVYGFQLSEELEIPVIVRTTTRVSHMRGIVEFGDIQSQKGKSVEGKHYNIGYFKKDPKAYIPVPANAAGMHKRLTEKIEKLQNNLSARDINEVVEIKDNAKIGVISSSSAYNYAYDVAVLDNLDMKILKLALSYPAPYDLIYEFIKDLDMVFVVEEVDPICEREVLLTVGMNGLNIPVHGKLDKTFPMVEEFNCDIVRDGFNKILKYADENISPSHTQSLEKVIEVLPTRAPTLCAGCSHRATYYGVKQALKESNINEENVIFASDIGCYTLGINPPYNVADYLLSMSSSIGDGCGFAMATDQKVISFIGDSTFFHSGVSPLINGVHNKQNFIVTILDNRITAMTGGQPNPGMPVDGMGDEAPEISIRELALASGASFVRVINPLNLKQTVDTYKKALENDGVSVIIAKSPCTLIKGFNKKPPVKVNYDKCKNCDTCVNSLACPAISKIDGKVVVDTSMCNGCSICSQICNYDAFETI
ncbi:indolepyruvate ferredoxin oxidoreductase subunit alpha [Methanobrevibacter sp.]